MTKQALTLTLFDTLTLMLFYYLSSAEKASVFEPWKKTSRVEVFVFVIDMVH